VPLLFLVCHCGAFGTVPKTLVPIKIFVFAFLFDGFEIFGSAALLLLKGLQNQFHKGTKK
jgi:hypothetical protein